jgi:hypothetical protein
MTERPQNKLIFLQFKHRKGHETFKKAKKKPNKKRHALRTSMRKPRSCKKASNA